MIMSLVLTLSPSKLIAAHPAYLLTHSQMKDEGWHRWGSGAR